MSTPSTRKLKRTNAKTPTALPMPQPLYDATAVADVVQIPARTVIALHGEGPPGGALFQACIAAIYGVAYTLKFTRKAHGDPDFKIGPLEVAWWTREDRQRSSETYRWELRMAVPDDVKRAELESVIRVATTKKGGKLFGNSDASRVYVLRLRKTKMGRALHVGPYANEAPTFERIKARMALAGLEIDGAHVEVYLSDPRRTVPKKLKTVLLLEPKGVRRKQTETDLAVIPRPPAGSPARFLHTVSADPEC